jgi:hypothetical protein
MVHELKGYHGTSLSSATQIVKSNYELSIGDKEWLGDGVYFFIEGLSTSPNEQARKWAIAQAWNTKNKIYGYKKYAVLKSTITVHDDNLLDLTTEDGIKILEYIYDRFEDKIRILKKKLKFIDGLLINLARGEQFLDIDVAKGNFYIKFARERIKAINLRTPNCTICAVYAPNKNLSEVKIVNIADVEHKEV